MKKKILSIALVVVMVVAGIAVGVPTSEYEVYAGTNGVTQAQAVSWARDLANRNAKVGTGQCVALINAYYNTLGNATVRGNATDYQSNALPGGWQRIWNYSGFSPQPGDIAVWKAYSKLHSSWTLDQYGHIGIVVSGNASSFVSVESNVNGLYCQYCNNRPTSYVTCWIRPDFTSPEPPATTIEPGSYVLRSALNNNLVLDVSGASTADGANVEIYNNNNSTAQRFNIVDKGNCYSIQPHCSGKALDTAGNSDVSGTNVQQWDWNGNNGQRWQIADAGGGYYYIRNFWGKYLDVAGGVNASGTNVQVCNFNGSNAQKWKLDRCWTGLTPDKYYRIYSAMGNYALDLSAGSTAYGGNLQLWSTNVKTMNQIFRVEHSSDGYFRIRPVCSGLYLDTDGNSSQSGANIQQWGWNGGNGQCWVTTQASKNGYHYIHSWLGKYIDVTDGKTANGTNIQSCNFNGSAAQQWKFVEVNESEIKPTVPEAVVSGERGNITVKWSGSKSYFNDGKLIYDVYIYKNSTVPGKFYAITSVARGVDSNKCNFTLPEGSYSVAVAAVEKKMPEVFSDTTLTTFKIDKEGNVVGSEATLKVIDPPRIIGPGSEKILDKDLVSVSNATYSGKAIVPTVKVFYERLVLGPKSYTVKDVLVKGTDYTVACSNNKNVGIAKVTVKGKGLFYSGTVTKTFKINPKGATIKTPKKAKKAFTAKWSKQSAKMSKSRITGYQVRYSLKKNFSSGVKTKTVKGYKKTSVKISKLKSKKTYYVQVRTYMKVDGKTYYSPWSKTKSVKTK